MSAHDKRYRSGEISPPALNLALLHAPPFLWTQRLPAGIVQFLVNARFSSMYFHLFWIGQFPIFALIANMLLPPRTYQAPVIDGSFQVIRLSNWN